MAVSKVTKERLQKRDNFRAQINVDQFLWACLYNSMDSYFDKKVMDYIRNIVAADTEATIRKHFTEQVQARPAFADHLNYYLKEYVEPELQENAKALWRELGWTQ